MRNWIKQAITTTGATGVGTVLSLGTAATDRLAFRDRYATAAELHNQTISDDTGTAINHMVFDGTLTYGTPDTLTITRIHEKITAGVLEVAPAAGLTLSGAGAGGVVALEHPEALLADRARLMSRGHILGLCPSRPTALTFQLSAGEVEINGVMRELPAATTAITATSDALVVSAFYLVYVTYEAGAVVQHWVQRTGTGAGADPVDKRLTIGQLSHPTLGDDYRFRCCFRTDSAGNIVEEVVTCHGREVRHASVVILTTSTATTAVELVLTALVPVSTFKLSTRLHNPSGTNGTYVTCFIWADAALSLHVHVVAAFTAGEVNGSYSSFPHAGNASLWYTRDVATTGAPVCYLVGFEYGV